MRATLEKLARARRRWSDDLPVPALDPLRPRAGCRCRPSSAALLSRGRARGSVHRRAGDAVSPLLVRCAPCTGWRSALVAADGRSDLGRGRARSAGGARHPSLDDRGHARHRCDGRAGRLAVPAQDRARCVGRRARRRSACRCGSAPADRRGWSGHGERTGRRRRLCAARIFILLALLPVAAVVLATLVARFAVLSALRKVV